MIIGEPAALARNPHPLQRDVADHSRTLSSHLSDSLLGLLGMHVAVGLVSLVVIFLLCSSMLLFIFSFTFDITCTSLWAAACITLLVCCIC
jgi:hypothetical protein